ncbi:MAG TPA: hypothetical protein VMB81_24210 [Candidatus Sulfotelmatobacter sp.]|nr:hypothetical protein [Candidatus Sulfotelmatobacter sp.]
MKLLIATDDAFVPGRLNGSLRGLLALTAVLIEQGIEPALLCRDPSAADARVRRYEDGVPIYTAADPAIAAAPLAVAGEAAALLVIDGGDGRILSACHGVTQPIIAWLARPLTWRASEPLAEGVTLMAASAPLAVAAQRWYGRPARILPTPVMRLDLSPTQEQAVLLDPRPAGGIEILFELAAARPRATFVVAETEPVPAAWRAACFERALRCGNIDWRTDPRDPEELFARARLLMAPALAADADPWAIRTAQTAGIPALASDRGVLAEAVGDAGIVVAADAPTATWLAAFDDLRRDGLVFARAVEAAARRRGGTDIGEIAAAIGTTIRAAVAGEPPSSQVA